jgi:hypothetical protein
MKVTSEMRKEITFTVGHSRSNQALHERTLRPNESTDIKIGFNCEDMEMVIRGGLLFSGEDKSFTTADLRSLKGKLESAKTLVRSPTARDMIDDVIDRLGF